MKSKHNPILSCLLLLSCFFFACSPRYDNDNLRVFRTFQVVKNLHGKQVQTEILNYNPLLMGLKDSVLVVCDVENSPYFHIYSLPGFEYLGNFGQEGKGPSEFQNPLFWGQFQNTEALKMWVYEMNTFSLSLLDIEKSLTSELFDADSVYSVPAELHDANNVMITPENVLIGSGPFQQGEFFIYNPLQEHTQWIAHRTDYGSQEHSLFKGNLDDIDVLKQGVAKIKPDGSHFVKALVYLPVIDVYRSDGEHRFSLVLNDYHLPVFNNGSFENQTNVWYENVFLSDNYIYALNRNCNMQHYFGGKCNDAEIHVFNWEGEAVSKYSLNEGIAPAAPFAVDESNNRVYTVNLVDYEPEYRVFDMK